MNRSDFFMFMVHVGFICLGASSCGVEGKTKTKTKTPEIGETPHECKQRGGSRLPAEREVLHGNQQWCNQEIHTSAFIPFVRL